MKDYVLELSPPSNSDVAITLSIKNGSELASGGIANDFNVADDIRRCLHIKSEENELVGDMEPKGYQVVTRTKLYCKIEDVELTFTQEGGDTILNIIGTEDYRNAKNLMARKYPISSTGLYISIERIPSDERFYFLVFDTAE